MKKIAVLCVMLSMKCSLAMSAWWEFAASVCAVASTMGNPVALAGSSITLVHSCENVLYEDLQEGKQYLREQGKKHHWNDQQKRIANEQYKDSFKWLHRAGSPDVFPDVY